MSTVIQNLIHNTLGHGARSTKFECLIIFNSPALFVGNELAALVKTSQFPGKSHDVIDFKYKGRNIPLKGQVKYDNTWTCTFYLTEDHKLKKGFEDWIESIDQVHGIKERSDDIISAIADNNKNGYTSDLTIYQMDFEGRDNKVAYHLRYAFPKSVSMVEVDYSAVGSILEYTVEFSYAYYDTENLLGKDKNFVDALKDKAMKSAKAFVGDLKNKATKFAQDQGAKLAKKFGFGGDDNKINTGGADTPSFSTKSPPVSIKVSGVNTFIK